MKASLYRMNDEEARKLLESIRWPNGPICAHCGSDNVASLNGKSCRPGLKKCRACRKQFTVTVGTIFERSHIGLGEWMFAFAAMCSSKKGISALQLQRQLNYKSYETAWFMCHRIREAMKMDTGFLKGDVVVDETYVGGKPRKKSFNPNKPFEKEPKTKAIGRGTKKIPVMVLVEVGGRAKTRVLVDVTAKTLRNHIIENVDLNSALHTDELAMYTKVGREFANGHHIVKHSLGQYTLPGQSAGTNEAESYFAILKRGIYGNFHSVSKKHLHRYCQEFDFRWNNREMDDMGKALTALKQSEGKRLMYKGVAINA